MWTAASLLFCLSIIYALVSEFSSTSTLLICVNFLSNAVRNTYTTGYVFGRFYRRYLHKPLRWMVTRLVVLVVLLAQLAWYGAVWVILKANRSGRLSSGTGNTIESY